MVTNDYNRKEVYFSEYCPKCQYWTFAENEDPCNECLGHPSNINSHRPINYKEKE